MQTKKFLLVWLQIIVHDLKNDIIPLLILYDNFNWINCFYTEKENIIKMNVVDSLNI